MRLIHKIVKFAGVVTQLKLLLKIIEDHKEAIRNNRNDGRKRLRVATMLTILENIRLGIQRCQFKTKTTETDLGPSSSSNSDGEQHQRRYTGEDEIEMLRKKLQAMSEVRKNLELSCANLADDKKRIAIELAKTTHLIKETEERINDLKPHNKILAIKVKKCQCEHKNKRRYCYRGFRSAASLLKEKQEKAILLENNETLEQNLEIAVINCQSIEIKEKQIQHTNSRIREEMKTITEKVNAGLNIFNQFKENMASRPGDTPAYIAKEIARLEHIFELFQNMVLNYKKKEECANQ